MAIDLNKYKIKPVDKQGDTGLKGFATGVTKGELSTLFGAGKLGTGIARTLLPKALEPKEPTFYERPKPEILETKTTAEKVGKFTEQVGEFAIPLTKIDKILQGANFLTKIATRAITAGAVASVQEGKIGKEVGIAAGVETALPFGSAIAKSGVNVMKRLFKGVGSGLSGVPVDVIETISRNPNQAIEITRQLERSGNFNILEGNAKQIINGIAKVKQQARKRFGLGLQQLKKTDIKPITFRQSTQPFLDKVGSTIVRGKRVLKNIEFDDPKNINRVTTLIDELDKLKLDGASIRKYISKVEASRYKVAISDERLSYNAFLGELESSVKNAITKSTGKLTEINKQFTKDMQLAEGMERIFGKVKFQNLREVQIAAQKLESLFSQKGLNPRDIDDFLKRIGIETEEFRTREAVRQISGQVVGGVNRPGVTIAEMLQSVTSAIVTPEAIRNISIATGLSEQVLSPILKRLSPTVRATLIKSLLGSE